MAYCTNAEVAAEFKNLTFSGSSTPTSTTVDNWIAQADAEIDSRVGLKYVVPLTGSNALIIAKQLSTAIVAERVRRTLKIKTSEEATRQDGRAGDTAKEARDMMTQIVEGKLKLSDATLASSQDGVASFNVSNGEEHTFEKSVDQW